MKCAAQMECQWAVVSDLQSVISEPSVDPFDRQSFAQTNLLPAIESLASLISQLFLELQQAIASKGEMGTIMNIQSHSLPSIITPTELDQLYGYMNFIGCYKDEENRDLNGANFSSSTMTPIVCINFCKSHKYQYAGVQFSSYCFCGNSYGSYGAIAPSNCMYNCSGDVNQKCGGYYANAIMNVSYTLPADTYPSKEFTGTVPIVIVPTVRTVIDAGEPFTLISQILSNTAPNFVNIYVAPIDSTNYVKYPFGLVTVGRQVYNVSLPPSAISNDFQYYVEADFPSQTVYFPSTAPSIPQTVVVAP